MDLMVRTAEFELRNSLYPTSDQHKNQSASRESIIVSSRQVPSTFRAPAPNKAGKLGTEVSIQGHIQDFKIRLAFSKNSWAFPTRFLASPSV